MSLDLQLEAISPPKLTAHEFDRFQALIHKETGIQLKVVKREMLSGRLARRLRALHLDSFSDYYDLLMKRDPARQELRNMINCVTTNKTSFFREPHHFDYLASWLRERTTQKQTRFRIWSAASSTGEEPYSIAITVAETLGPLLSRTDVRILASDIDTDVLETAQQGIYREPDLNELPLERKRNHFLKGKGLDAGLIKVKPELRNLISFTRMNLTEDTWPVRGPFDAIFCRNVMIYFDESTQRRLVERFFSLLVPGGYLFVGHSESLHWAHGMASSVGHAIYRSLNRQK